jgi:hypothetical protein
MMMEHVIAGLAVVLIVVFVLSGLKDRRRGRF